MRRGNELVEWEGMDLLLAGLKQFKRVGFPDASEGGEAVFQISMMEFLDKICPDRMRTCFQMAVCESSRAAAGNLLGGC